jgi:DNA invertase Pin-like site-specific DNA recombinase
VACRRREVEKLVALAMLDRLARSVRHLTALAAELEAFGVDLIGVDPARTAQPLRARVAGCAFYLLLFLSPDL